MNEPQDSRQIPRPSHSGLLDRFTEALRASGEDAHIGLLVIKVVNLREINAVLGPRLADRLLMEIGERIGSVVRGQDHFARLSGSRFAVLVQPECHAELLELAAARIHRLFDMPLGLGDPPQYALVRIGGSLYPDNGQTVEALLAAAESALDDAIGANQSFRINSPDRADARQRELRLPAEISRGLESDEFELLYQPQIDLSSNRVAGMEALLRWNRRDGTVLDPERFIPAAERSEQLFPLTRWVFHTALRHFAEFIAIAPEAQLSMNLAAPLLISSEAFDAFTDGLAIWGIAPEQVTIEVTETVMMVEPETSIDSLNRYAALGSRISIDDFGTGFSSLSYLKDMPVSELKIDRSFVTHMGQNVGDHTIVRSIIDLAHNFGLQVVAEGVETEDSLAELRVLGCDVVQGYLFGKPMPASEMLDWLTARDA